MDRDTQATSQMACPICGWSPSDEQLREEWFDLDVGRRTLLRIHDIVFHAAPEFIAHPAPGRTYVTESGAIVDEIDMD